MRTWRADIEVTVHDDGAMELRAITGMHDAKFEMSPRGTVSVHVNAETAEDAFPLALREAAALLERTAR
jgi:hypothetical protein